MLKRNKCNQPQYTLEQIRSAYWEEFHEAGEIWFGHKADPDGANQNIERFWDDFVKTLTQEKGASDDSPR